MTQDGVPLTQNRTTSEAAAAVPAAERRERDDRRDRPELNRRARKPSRLARFIGVGGRELAIVVAALATIMFVVRSMHPIYANSPPVAQALVNREPLAPVAEAVLEPPAPSKDSSAVDKLVATPEFEADRKAFAADLVATGRMSQGRADSIAFYAVREAYIRGIPPAVIFGVMLTENAQFVSKAMSDVGAVGLMQIYPKIWLKELSAKFGQDLASDSTNLKYGVYILAEYLKPKGGKVSQESLMKGLLRYNGCVRGTHTPHCKTYPTKVKSYVEKEGDSLCGDKSFYDCIAKPFVAGLFGKSEETH
jgi:hypothetical protein